MEFFGNSWDNVLDDEFNKDYFVKLIQNVADEYSKHTVFPPQNKVFSAFKLTPFDKVRVVILGQDPYHELGQAHGVSFSVLPNIDIPPSLKNIYKEIVDDVGGFIPNNGCLVPWCRQGVLLLNSVLTVQKGLANSHRKFGWETFTDNVISKLNQRKNPIIFLLWGNNALRKKDLITSPWHVVLTAPHPSPLSAYSGFFGCKHFSKTNEYLKVWNQEPINWQISNI